MGTQFQATVSLYQLGLAQKAILGLFFMDELLDDCGPEKPVIFLQINGILDGKINICSHPVVSQLIWALYNYHLQQNAVFSEDSHSFVKEWGSTRKQ